MIKPLLQNAAFTLIVLQDLQEEIARSGPVESYQNGENQHGLKPSSALTAFNSTIKNYSSLIKNLTGFLPTVPKRPVFPMPNAIREKTEEEWEEELREMEERDAQVRREMEEASRRQREQWAREGRPRYTE